MNPFLCWHNDSGLSLDEDIFLGTNIRGILTFIHIL